MAGGYSASVSAQLLTALVAAMGVLAGAGTGFATAPVAPDPPTPFVHPPDVHDPDCVIEIQAGDSLSLIADAMPDTAVTYGDLQAENDLADADHIEAGDLLDICVGNQIDDITGETRTNVSGDVLDPAVAAQQRAINAAVRRTRDAGTCCRWRVRAADKTAAMRRAIGVRFAC